MDFVGAERPGDVAEVRMARPDRMNALDGVLATALPAALASVARDVAIRAVILSGEGRTFIVGGALACFHADLGAAPAMAKRLIDSVHDAVRSITTMPKPVIAAVQGSVAGSGIGFACDFVVAAADASFFSAYVPALTAMAAHCAPKPLFLVRISRSTQAASIRRHPAVRAAVADAASRRLGYASGT